MRILLTAITILTFTTSLIAGGKDGNVTIKGSLDNAEGKTIFLEYFVQNQPVKIDSFQIKKNGKFEMSANVTEPDFYRIGFGASNFALLILEENQDISMSGDAEELNKTYKVSGSKDSEKVKEFVTGLNSYGEKTVEINAKFNNPNTTEEEKTKLKTEGEKARANFEVFRDKFILENYKSLATLTTLSQLNETKDFELIKKIESGIAESYPNSKYHVSMTQKVKQIETRVKQIEEANKLKENSAIGKVAPALNYEDPNGKVITLESLRGNYVLIDFWASWCRPCRMENPNVVKAYNKYKDKGFTVFSVSLDKDKARWVNAIEKDGLIWPNHVSDLKQWQSSSVKIYGFSGIPHTVLIDKEGKILQKNLRGPALEKKLEEIFGF